MDNHEFDVWWDGLKKGRPDLEVFDSYYFQGFTVGELARKFELSESGIAARLRRARSFLRNELSGKRAKEAEMRA